MAAAASAMPGSNAAPPQLSMQFQGDSSLLRLVCHLLRLQVTFSILIVLRTWLSPLQGCLVDKFGPRVLIAFGCALSGAG
jgi:MFS family permease